MLGERPKVSFPQNPGDWRSAPVPVKLGERVAKKLGDAPSCGGEGATGTGEGEKPARAGAAGGSAAAVTVVAGGAVGVSGELSRPPANPIGGASGGDRMPCEPSEARRGRTPSRGLGVWRSADSSTDMGVPGSLSPANGAAGALVGLPRRVSPANAPKREERARRQRLNSIFGVVSIQSPSVLAPTKPRA